MSNKNTMFYRKKQEINYNVSAEEISTDGAIFLLEKIERKHRLIKNFCSYLPDQRHQSYTEHTIEEMLKQRVFLIMQGYQHCNDEKYLRNDTSNPTFKGKYKGVIPCHSALALDYGNDLYWIPAFSGMTLQILLFPPLGGNTKGGHIFTNLRTSSPTLTKYIPVGKCDTSIL